MPNIYNFLITFICCLVFRMNRCDSYYFSNVYSVINTHTVYCTTLHACFGVEGQPWVPDGSTVGPRFLGGNRGFPHKNRQPWVPATSFLFCVRWATRPNCQPLTLSHLESDGGPTASMPSAARPHCILPARNLETLTIF